MVPAVTVKVPFPISLVNATVPVASGRVIVLSPVNVPANKVSSLPSAALPSNITPFDVDTVSTLFVVVVPTTVKLPAITTSFGNPIVILPEECVTSISLAVPTIDTESVPPLEGIRSIELPPDTDELLKS